MIEVLKQALEALEKSLPRLAPYGEQDWLDSKAAITSLRRAIREHAMYEVQRLGQEIEQESVADDFFRMIADRNPKPFPPSQRTEQNFCPRCGKRTNDIHTCTPQQDNT